MVGEWRRLILNTQPRRATAVVTLFLATLLLLVPTQTPAASEGGKGGKLPVKGRKLPDLQPTAGGLDGDPWVLIGDRWRGKWRGTVRNNNATAAGPTLTAVYLAPSRLRSSEQRRAKILAGATPKLNAKKSERVTALPVGLPNDLKPGEYRLIVCADARNAVKESNENNNCLLAGKRGTVLYVAFGRWSGSIRGFSPLIAGGSTREDWSSSDAAFRFIDYVNPGYFSYVYTGPVTYSYTGTSEGNCTVSGRGSVSDVGGALGIDYSAETYSATGSTSEDEFDFLMDCGTGPEPRRGPEHFVFLSTGGEEGRSQDLPFQADQLNGSIDEPDGTYIQWNLKGVPEG